MRPIPLACSLVLAALAAAPASAQPSFDCARAGTAVERAICASPALSLQDREVNAAYLSIGGLPGVAESQRAWLAERNRRCGSAMEKATQAEREACLNRSYAERIAQLRAAGRAAPPPPPAETGWEGPWHPTEAGLRGELTLRQRSDGNWDAALRTGRQAPPNPTCEAEWIAQPMTDGSLVGRTDGGTGPTILLRREGPRLHVATTDQGPLCGLNGGFAGGWGR